jgi:hypothetical protein
VLAAVALLLAGIPDLAWAGTYTYWSRTASRLLVLLVLFVVGGGVTAARRASRRAAGSPARR